MYVRVTSVTTAELVVGCYKHAHQAMATQPGHIEEKNCKRNMQTKHAGMRMFISEVLDNVSWKNPTNLYKQHKPFLLKE